ncbi:uncharacterized protein MONBRDRAFT_33349 [Monosiga brevicollis MX1]|uniref:Uncharacterized protein n=1 Tax=Monosiga brevicollis TaxID=81824 RepID=A9V4X0_MONBE|nr:uncharacterized protein MONBRDRAFT_33349 [Monosiga brevicollis MX1]EDQ87443.1 predicted protein [Monosiga brevicollis MX1]|eukprot:XP_001747703.1 hypothetical protein [Monosiga brevicollis MX1]
MVTLSGDLAATSASTAGTILLLNIVGICMAVFPLRPAPEESGIVSKEGIRVASQIAARILMPCLSFINVAELQDISSIWPVSIWHLVSIPFCILVSYMLSFLFRVPNELRAIFVAAASFSNLASLAYVIMQTLCEQPELDVEDECYDRAAGFIAISIIPWHLLFWTAGDYTLSLAARAGTDYTPKAPLSKEERRAARIKSAVDLLLKILNPNLVATLVGVLVSQVDVLHDLFFVPIGQDSGRPPLSFVTSAVSSLADASVGLTTIIIAATLGKRLLRVNWRKLRARLLCRYQPNVATTHPAKADSPDFIIATSFAALSPDSSPQLNAASSTATTTTTADNDNRATNGGASANNKDAANDDDDDSNNDAIFNDMPSKTDVEMILADKSDPAKLEGNVDAAAILAQARRRKGRLSPTFFLQLIFVRVYLMGGLLFAMVYLISPLVFPDSQPDSSLIRLVFFVQCIVPSANLIVLLAQQRGLVVIAEDIALAMLCQHILSALSSIFFTAIALSIVYDA